MKLVCVWTQVSCAYAWTEVYDAGLCVDTSIVCVCMDSRVCCELPCSSLLLSMTRSAGDGEDGV
jgi:hypothetical protein